MINKTISISTSQLDTMETIIITPDEIALDILGQRYFPYEFQIANETGFKVMYNVLFNQQEFKWMQEKQPWMGLVTLHPGDVISDGGKSQWFFYGIAVRGCSVANEKGLEIELMHYYTGSRFNENRNG